MPTYSYDERMKVVAAMDATGQCACPRCGNPIEMHRLQTAQDKVLKRPGRPLYRCSNRACLLECSAPGHMTIPPGQTPPPK
jgi:predicted nucleic acid-binding Zn ribbon protein